MSEDRHERHPEPEAVELLARYLNGELQDDLRTRVQEHLAGCASCRLELRQIARFLALESDDDAANEAAWELARPVLDARVAARVLPAADRSARRAWWHEVARRRWWLPVAAAAAVALIVVGVERATLDPYDHGPDGAAVAADRAGPLRSGGSAAAQIVARRPLGVVATAPDTFAWIAPAGCGQFTLEIYTPELRTILRREQIPTPHHVISDSLRRSLTPDSLYLWSVRCFDALELVGVMPESWFRIVP